QRRIQFKCARGRFGNGLIIERPVFLVRYGRTGRKPFLIEQLYVCVPDADVTFDGGGDHGRCKEEFSDILLEQTDAAEEIASNEIVERLCIFGFLLQFAKACRGRSEEHTSEL